MHHPTTAAAHVEAFCCTGTSPGVAGQAPVTLRLERGGTVRVKLGYEVHGPAYGPAVVVLGGISANRHLAPTAGDPSPGWWPEVIGPGKALDPTRQRLIGVDFLGGPRTPVPHSQITTGDQARALLQVLRAVGAAKATLVGSSYGGMVALAAAAERPDVVSALVVLCAAHRPHPLGTAWRSIQRDLARFAAGVGNAQKGLALGRALAMTTYRSDVEFDARFGHRVSGEGEASSFPVESYLGAHGEAFARKFDTAAFLRLSESVDLHDVDPARIGVPTTLVSFDTDRLVPPWLVSELAESAPGVTEHVTVASLFGHDAFLKEGAAVSEVIRRALTGPSRTARRDGGEVTR